MKKKKMHTTLIVLSTVLFTSCASKDSLCTAYAHATIKEDRIKVKTTQPHDLKTIEKKRLEEKPRNFNGKIISSALTEENYTNL